MRIGKKSTTKRVAPRRSVYRRRAYRPRQRRVPMPLAPTGSFASRSETFELTTTAGTTYDLNNITLSMLAACKQIAKFYQYYRITSVQMRFKPNCDTYAPGSVVLPYLYFLYDKSGSLGSLSGPQFLAAGAKPIRVDDRTIIRRWKPSVQLLDTDGAYCPMFKTSPWMPTHLPNGTTLNDPKHFGAVWYISKINTGDAQTYNIDVTINVQFRKPLAEATAPGLDV